MNDTTSPRDASFAGPGRPPTFLDALAEWFEHSVDETVGWRHSSRLYGLTVLDCDALVARGTAATGAVRFTYLAHGWVYDLLAGPSAEAATRYDALALCCFGRATHLETLEQSRCRTVLVADGAGVSTVNRLRGQPPVLTGRPTGPVAELVAELFARRDRQRATEQLRHP